MFMIREETLRKQQIGYSTTLMHLFQTWTFPLAVQRKLQLRLDYQTEEGVSILNTLYHLITFQNVIRS